MGDALKYGFNFILQKNQKMQELFTQALGIYSPWLVKDVELTTNNSTSILTSNVARALFMVAMRPKPIVPMTPE